MSRTGVSMFLLSVLVTMAIMRSADGDEGGDKKNTVKKLQIGIKKRVENCKLKSKKGDIIHVHYTGKLQDGSEFDSSYARGDPLAFTLGQGQVIKGWDQGLMGMCVGEQRKLVIPPELGYGATGSPPKIPGNSVLIFEVELMKIDRKDDL